MLKSLIIQKNSIKSNIYNQKDIKHRNKILKTKNVKSHEESIILNNNIIEPDIIINELKDNSIIQDDNWKLSISNNSFVFGLTSQYKNNILYSLIQILGSINISEYQLHSNGCSSVISLMIDEKNIINPGLLWKYCGIREDYQYAVLKIASDGDLIVLSSFTEKITYAIYEIDKLGNKILRLKSIESKSKDINYNYFLAKFSIMPAKNGEITWSNTKFITKISAINGLKDLFMDIDKDDNIYITGTFDGSLHFDPVSPIVPPITNLVNDFFITKIKNGIPVWIKTSEIDYSKGIIRSTSINIDNFNNIYILGTFTNILKLGDYIVKNMINNINTWIAKITTNGEILWVITIPPQLISNSKSYMNGTNIINDNNNNIYITGEFIGEFKFDDIILKSDTPSIYISKLKNTEENLKWEWVKQAKCKFPSFLKVNPCLTCCDKYIYIIFSGKGLIYYCNELDEIIQTYSGSGSLDNYICDINIDTGNWGNNFILQSGILNNSCNSIINSSNSVYFIGTSTIGFSSTDGFISKYKIII